MDVVYLDNSVVSAKGKLEQSDELHAIAAIYQRHAKQELRLVTSEMTHREINKLKGSNRGPVEAVYADLAKVQFIEASKLVGINSWWGAYGGWNSPILEEEQLLRKIKAIGLDQNDAQHVMIASRNGCSVFLTLDKKTILRFKLELETAVSLRFRLPTQYEIEKRAGRA